MNQKDLVLIGAGNCGREILWQLSESVISKKQYNILGFIDDTPVLQGTIINGLHVLGNIQWLVNYKKDICAIICVGSSQGRKSIYNRLMENHHIEFPTVVMEGVKCSDTIEFGQGCIICISSILTINIAIGDFVLINYNSVVSHDTILEDYVTIYPSVNISGNVHIGDCTEIGVGARVIEKRKIGANTIIGAGAVVCKDIPDNCTAVGIPAKPIIFHE